MTGKNSKKALFSVMPHIGLEVYARRLVNAGWEIIATCDAAKFLEEKGIRVQNVAEFNDISDCFGFPPTLHPKIEAALTTDSSDRIELVYDVPYAREAGNDVGGRTLLALAAKGNRIPVSNQFDMENVVQQLSAGEIEDSLRAELVQKAYLVNAQHYVECAGERQDNVQVFAGEKQCLLLNGENMYQQPSHLYKFGGQDALALHNFKRVSGNMPCFTNMADLDSILDTLCKLYGALVLNCIPKAYVAVASKHGNACGIGVSQNEPSDALLYALWGNPQGIWGGEIITNFPIDSELAKILKKSDKRKKLFGRGEWMLDVIAAPQIGEGAIDILSSNPNRKLFVNEALQQPSLNKGGMYRCVRGGFLTQPMADFLVDLKELVWTNGDAIQDKISLVISWAAAYTSFHGGNETAVAKDGALLGVGGGPSTYDATKTAFARAVEQKHSLEGSVFGADAFFPFEDVPKLLSDAGCIGGTVPAGGKRHAQVAEFFRAKNMKVGFIGEDYRGFCRH